MTPDKQKLLREAAIKTLREMADKISTGDWEIRELSRRNQISENMVYGEIDHGISNMTCEIEFFYRPEEVMRA